MRITIRIYTPMPIHDAANIYVATYTSRHKRCDHSIGFGPALHLYINFEI